MTATTVREFLDLASDVAVPNGSRQEGQTGAGVRVRARARVAPTEGDGNVIPLRGSAPVVEAGPSAIRRAVASVAGVAADTAATVKADAAGWWVVRNQPPSLADLWAGRCPPLDAYPGGSQLLRAVDVAVRHAALLPYGLLFGYLWLLHRGVTAIPTVLITAALVAMWLT